MVQGLWGRQIYTIIDVKLGDADADSYKYEPMVAIDGNYLVITLFSLW